jgi:hypothetical protein
MSFSLASLQRIKVYRRLWPDERLLCCLAASMNMKGCRIESITNVVLNTNIDAQCSVKFVHDRQLPHSKLNAGSKPGSEQDSRLD